MVALVVVLVALMFTFLLVYLLLDEGGAVRDGEIVKQGPSVVARPDSPASSVVGLPKTSAVKTSASLPAKVPTPLLVAAKAIAPPELKAISLHGYVAEGGTGEMVEGAVVFFVKESGDYTTQTLTDGEGLYALQDIPLPIGQGVIYARKGERVSASRMVRQGDREINLALTAGGKVGGIVLLKPDEMAMAGVDVVLRTYYMSAFRMKTVSDDEGRFAFDVVPPGSYVVEGFAETYYEPPNRGQLLEKKEFVVFAGGAVEQIILMRKMAEVTGRVLEYDGLVCGDAEVTMRATWGLHGPREERTVAVGADGRFSIHTGRVHQDERIRVRSKLGGDLSVTVKDLREGETRDIGDITLPGGVHVMGRVRDEMGRGIGDVSIRAIAQGASGKSNYDGTFDLGWVSMSKDNAPFRFRFAPIKKGSGAEFPFSALGFADGSNDAAFDDGDTYAIREVTREAKVGEELYLDVTMETAQMAGFSGRIVRADGGVVLGGKVVLFAGNAGPKSWVRYANPMTMMISSYAPSKSEMVLGRATSDENGEWNIRFVWQDRGKGNYWEKTTEDVFEFSLGAVGSSGGERLVKNLEMRSPEVRRGIEIVVEESANEGKLTGTIVDSEGKGVAGVIMMLSNAPGRPEFISDAEGRFEIDFAVTNTAWVGRISDVKVESKSEAWVIVSENWDTQRLTFKRLPNGEWPQDVTIVVDRPGEISGRAVWDDDTPVVGFDVSARGQRLTVGNAMGTFVLKGLAAGAAYVYVASDVGFKQRKKVTVVAGKTVEAEFRLPKGDRRLEGTCLKRDGTPLAGLQIQIWGAKANIYDGEVTSNAQGEFICKLSAGDYSLGYTLPGDRRRGSLDVTVPEDKESVSVVIQDKTSNRVVVEVVDLDEKPVEGVRLRYDMKYFSTDPQGFCAIDVNSSSGRVTISVHEPERTGVDMMQYSVPLGESYPTHYRICLGEGFRISGRAMCGSVPVENIHVTMMKSGEYRFGSIHTKADGEFSFGGLKEGERVTIRGSSYQSNVRVSREVVVTGDVADVDIQIPTGRVRGRLLDSKGRLLKRYSARLAREGVDTSKYENRPATRLSEDGLVEFVHVADGTYRMALMDEREVVVQSGEIVISGGNTVEGIDLRLGE